MSWQGPGSATPRSRPPAGARKSDSQRLWARAPASCSSGERARLTWLKKGVVESWVE
ncbi:MAG: hypothetical protein AB7O29_01955 [Acidimicrobiia bacterium]